MYPTGILLTGIYYSGKTTTANFLGDMVDFQILDLDEMYTMEFKETIWDTRDRDDAEARQRRDVIASEIMQRMNLAPSVVVLGGGSYFQDHPDRLAKVKEALFVVYLNPTIDALTSRVINHPEKDVRHIFAHRNPRTIKNKFKWYYRERTNQYLEWSDVFVQPEADWDVEQVGYAVLSEFVKELTHREKSGRRT